MPKRRRKQDDGAARILADRRERERLAEDMELAKLARELEPADTILARRGQYMATRPAPRLVVNAGLTWRPIPLDQVKLPQ